MMLASLLLLMPTALPVAQEPILRDPTGRAVIYRFDTVETLDGDALKNVTVLVRDGIIERMGQAVVIPDNAEIHDYRGSGKVAMPPLVLTHADFLISDRRGGGRNGRFLAVDSMWLPEDWSNDLLEEGVLLVGVDPPGSGMPGRSSVLLADHQIGVPNPLVADLHLKVNVGTGASAKRLVRDGLKAADQAIDKESKAKADWEKARADWDAAQKKKAEEAEAAKKKGAEGGKAAAGDEGKGKEKGKDKESKEPPKEFVAPKLDPNVAPLVDWVRKERVAQIWLRSASDWLHWQDVLGERELPYEFVLRHGSGQNFHEVVTEIAATGLRVDAIAGITFLPYTRTRVNLPAELVAAGVEKLVLSPSSSTLTGLRNFRLSVAGVVAEGLDRAVALRAMTLEPAASLGQDERVTALAVGAPATFVVWSGDPLNPMTEALLVLSEGEVLYDRVKAEKEEQR
jgi:hypothetical protein